MTRPRPINHGARETNCPKCHKPASPGRDGKPRCIPCGWNVPAGIHP